MDARNVNKIVCLMNEIAYGFMGHSLTQEQFDQIDKEWNVVRASYIPCTYYNTTNCDHKITEQKNLNIDPFDLGKVSLEINNDE